MHVTRAPAQNSGLDAPCIPNTFLINIGDQFARWTSTSRLSNSPLSALTPCRRHLRVHGAPRPACDDQRPVLDPILLRVRPRRAAHPARDVRHARPASTVRGRHCRGVCPQPAVRDVHRWRQTGHSGGIASEMHNAYNIYDSGARAGRGLLPLTSHLGEAHARPPARPLRWIL